MLPLEVKDIASALNPAPGAALWGRPDGASPSAGGHSAASPQQD